MREFFTRLFEKAVVGIATPKYHSKHKRSKNPILLIIFLVLLAIILVSVLT